MGVFGSFSVFFGFPLKHKILSRARERWNKMRGGRCYVVIEKREVKKREVGDEKWVMWVGGC